MKCQKFLKNTIVVKHSHWAKLTLKIDLRRVSVQLVKNPRTKFLLSKENTISLWQPILQLDNFTKQSSNRSNWPIFLSLYAKYFINILIFFASCFFLKYCWWGETTYNTESAEIWWILMSEHLGNWTIFSMSSSLVINYMN